MRTVRIKILHQLYRYFNVPIFLFFFLCAWSSVINAETLEGKVLGVDNKPKQYASVSIFGAENRRTQTDQNGEFSVNLPPGSYVIRIWQQPNRQDFNCQINRGLTETQIFKVGW
jgi:Carboxypeptidase regulatory-like domain